MFPQIMRACGCRRILEKPANGIADGGGNVPAAILGSVRPQCSGSGAGEVRNRHPALSHGFTLIELLIVLNLAAYVLWLVLPSFTTTPASRISEAAFGISVAVARAREEAVARNTYVWMALQQESNEQLLGVRVGLVASKNGLADTNASNLIPIGPAVLYRGVGISPAAASALAIPGTNPVLAGDFTGGPTFSIGSHAFIGGSTLTFLPLGEVTTNPCPGSTAGFDPLFVIPLRVARGTNLFSGNDAAVVIDGSVGNPVIYRK